MIQSQRLPDRETSSQRCFLWDRHKHALQRKHESKNQQANTVKDVKTKTLISSKNIPFAATSYELIRIKSTHFQRGEILNRPSDLLPNLRPHDSSATKLAEH